MKLSHIPQKLKESIIPPIHKGGSKADAANYRPVSLTSHLIKIYEKTIRKKLTQHLDERNFLNPNQHGFRPGRSCLTQLLSHYDNIISLQEKGQNVDVVYLDFSKAFDKVDHNILLHKLDNLGIKGKTLKWIQQFLTNRSQRVMVNGKLSSPHQVISGVPQGSVIGPLLFLVLINDIDKDTAHSMVASFADDTRVTKGLSTQEDACTLQNDLFQIYHWSEQNNMQFNALKFELIRYGKNTALKEDTAYINPDFELIGEKETVKDLGITLQNTCNFRQHIHNIAEAAKKMSSWILRTFETRERVPMMILYKSLVRPLMEYSSPLWNPINKDDIKTLEAIQKAFITRIKGISRDYTTALKQLNLYSLEARRNRYTAIHVWKICENMAPNLHPDNGIQLQTDCNHRRGRTCKEYNLRKTPSHLQKARKQTLRVHGAKIFNKLPKEIRNLTSTTVHQFKSMLDCHLRSRVDVPLPSNAQHTGWQRTNQPTNLPTNQNTPPIPVAMLPDITSDEQHTTESLTNPIPENQMPARGLNAEMRSTR